MFWEMFLGIIVHRDGLKQKSSFLQAHPIPDYFSVTLVTMVQTEMTCTQLCILMLS